MAALRPCQFRHVEIRKATRYAAHPSPIRVEYPEKPCHTVRVQLIFYDSGTQPPRKSGASLRVHNSPTALPMVHKTVHDVHQTRTPATVLPTKLPPTRLRTTTRPGRAATNRSHLYGPRRTATTTTKSQARLRKRDYQTRRRQTPRNATSRPLPKRRPTNHTLRIARSTHSATILEPTRTIMSHLRRRQRTSPIRTSHTPIR